MKRKAALGWRSAVIAVVALAGCEPAAMMGSMGIAAPPRATEVLDGSVSVRPPRGYCVDPASGQEAEDTAVVMAGRCSDKVPVDPAIMTVSIGRSGSAATLAAGGAALSEYFTSAEGRVALSRSGRANDVRITKAYSKGPAFLLHVQDRVAGGYWRSVLGIRGRLVTVSITAPPGSELDEAAGEVLIEAMLSSLTRGNAVPRQGESLPRDQDIAVSTASRLP